MDADKNHLTRHGSVAINLCTVKRHAYRQFCRETTMILLNRFEPMMLRVFPGEAKFIPINLLMAKKMCQKGMTSYVDDEYEADEFAKQLGFPVCENRTYPLLSPGDRALLGIPFPDKERRMRIRWAMIKIT